MGHDVSRIKAEHPSPLCADYPRPLYGVPPYLKTKDLWVGYISPYLITKGLRLGYISIFQNKGVMGGVYIKGYGTARLKYFRPAPGLSLALKTSLENLRD